MNAFVIPASLCCGTSGNDEHAHRNCPSDRSCSQACTGDLHCNGHVMRSGDGRAAHGRVGCHYGRPSAGSPDGCRAGWRSGDMPRVLRVLGRRTHATRAGAPGISVSCRGGVAGHGGSRSRSFVALPNGHGTNVSARYSGGRSGRLIGLRHGRILRRSLPTQVSASMSPCAASSSSSRKCTIDRMQYMILSPCCNASMSNDPFSGRLYCSKCGATT